MGRSRAPCAWKEPVFSPGTDAQRRLPVALGLADWQAEQTNSERQRCWWKGAVLSLSFDLISCAAGAACFLPDRRAMRVRKVSRSITSSR